LFGAEAHEGQFRKTGEPYIYHPIHVASILADLHVDAATLTAAILHDVIEDTDFSRAEISEKFGEEIATLVDGVSKLTRIQFDTPEHAQAENFRKMLMAMTQDIRVMLIKLADRLHNMRTLDGMRAEKRRRIARETLDIYVPIANRLGINRFRIELEDLGFRHLHPNRYRILSDAVRRRRGNRKEILLTIETAIRRRLEQEGVQADIAGREKHLYSLFRKMREKHLSFDEVLDLYAFRIIVSNVDACYRTLGIVHNLYKPIPGKFKDYIAIPKANGYQSLHTILFGPHGVPVEIQVRTQDMHDVAENGIAAHWEYKNGESDNPTNAEQRVRKWMQHLLDLQKTAGDSIEFLDNVRVDLFPDEIYVFTPRGKILELPRGATVIDFAYAVHTDLGNTCVAARVNRRPAPLSIRLSNGQTVEILTAPHAHPSPTWLGFVVTGKARSSIRSYLKNLQDQEALILGQRLLDRELDRVGLRSNKLPATPLKELLAELSLHSLDELRTEIGLGRRMPALIARRLLDNSPNLPGQAHTPAPLTIRGTEGMVVQYARCCHPIPGDPVIGHLNTGRGIVVHVRDCSNVRESHDRPENWIDVEWAEGIQRDFAVELRVDVDNARGVLATCASAIAAENSNIDNVNVSERDGNTSTITFVLRVQNRDHLAKVMRALRVLTAVQSIQRSYNKRNPT
jgi:guanosine-3',5'-bis(diphosphate) 3'-pyrophosphohydrolase